MFRILGAAFVIVAIAAATASCASNQEEDIHTPAATERPVLDFAWTRDGVVRRLVVSSDGEVISRDTNSRTGYSRRMVPRNNVADATRRARGIIEVDGREACAADNSPRVSATVIANASEWHYEMSGLSFDTASAGNRECWPALETTIERIAADLTASGSRTDYADRVVLDLGGPPPPGPATWPLKMPLRDLPIRWHDERKLSGCAVIPGSAITRFDQTAAILNTESASRAEPTTMRMNVLLPGQSTCGVIAPASVTTPQSITHSDPHDTVIDLATHLLLPGTGGQRVVVHADGSAIVDDSASPTGYTERQVSVAKVVELAQQVATILRTPKADYCLVSDGMLVTAKLRTDQGAWEREVANPGPCGWPEFAALTDEVKQQVVSSGGAGKPYQF
ncbi:hypothetical protein [Gordonia sp. CPCC 205333]|uniref:hypothetical protein n=1 Tax=Gordonia sp. CPCC 205333 TaxID=3140790 RepID=UPI003AF396C0